MLHSDVILRLTYRKSSDDGQSNSFDSRYYFVVLTFVRLGLLFVVLLNNRKPIANFI
jgi:hypothetical protein